MFCTVVVLQYRIIFSKKTQWFQDSPKQQEKSKVKKTDDIQPDDEEVEEEFEDEEPETKSTGRPASKMDLEEPIAASQNEEDEDEDGEEVKNSTHSLIRFEIFNIYFHFSNMHRVSQVQLQRMVVPENENREKIKLV